MIRAAIFLLVIWDALKAYFGLDAPIIQFLILGPILGLGFASAFAGSGSNVLVSRPISIWLVWIIYALFNTFLVVGFDPYRETSAAIFISSILLGPIFVGLLASRRVGTKAVLDTVIAALFVRMLLSFIFDGFGKIGVDQYSRFGVDFNSNAIASGAFFLLVALIIRRREFLKRRADMLAFALAIVTLVATASVKFFAAAALFLLCIVFYDMSRKAKAGRVKKSIAIAWCAALIAVAILPQTSLVARTQDKYERSMRAESSTQLFDNRAAQYILGWEEFIENPVNGIGLRNFMNLSGNTAPLHSEYLVQLVENGVVGVLIFVAFWVSLVGALLKSLRWREFREIGLLHCYSIGALLYLYLGIWSYNIPFNWILIGLALRHVLDVREAMARSRRMEGNAYSTGAL